MLQFWIHFFLIGVIIYLLEMNVVLCIWNASILEPWCRWFAW